MNNNKNDKVGNCPFCRGVIFKDFKVNKEKGETSFLMRCPHCQKDIRVMVGESDIKVKKIDESR